MSEPAAPLRVFLRSRKGNVAIEFALIAPILVALLIGVIDYGRFTFERSDMLAAGRSGAQYFMAGGTDPVRAQTIIQTSWSHMPTNGVVDVQRVCECQSVAAQCNQPCSDGTVPLSYAVINLGGTIDGIFLDLSARSEERVRVR